MPGEADFQVEATPSLQQLIDYFVAVLTSPGSLSRLVAAMTKSIEIGMSVAKGAEVKAVTDTARDEGTFVTQLESWGGAASGFLMALLVRNTFDVDASASDFAHLGASGGKKAIARAVAAKMVEGLTGGSTSVEPSEQPAANYLSVVFGQIFEAWTIGELVEIASAIFPGIEKVEHLADLADKMINALGISDSSSRVLRPYIDNLVVEPLRRHIAKTYRPNLLSEAEIVRAFLRGDYTGGEAAEELAQIGYSERRQDMLIKSAARRLSLDDVMTLVREGTLDRDYAEQNLRDEGFDQETAHLLVIAADTKRYRSLADDSLAAVVSAYVNRDLNDAELSSFLPAIIPDDVERGVHETTARTRRDLNVKHLSHGEVVDCVKKLILPVSAYRDWLAREGYRDEDATALEVRLAMEIDAEARADAERARINQEKKTAADKSAAEKADRLAQLEVERARRRRGSIADLTRAFVRGLIPLARLQEVFTAEYDADTVTTLSDLAVAQRADFVRQQQAADDARRRAAHRNIDVGAIEAAVLENVLTLQEFRARLGQLQFDPADADLLAATLAARKRDLDDARAKRAQAEDAAKHKSIDLGRAEELVIRGHGTLEQYDALLASLGFDAAARAAMVDLLRARAGDYAKAQKARADADAKLHAKDVTADDVHRAVVLGTRTIDDYQAYLVKHEFTADAIALLVANANQDAAEADAARKRRRDADARRVEPALALDRVARAVQLGVVTPAAYKARLQRAGYSADDVAIDMDLLVAEIADAKRRRDRAAGLTSQGGDRGLSLGQLAAAVKIGAAALEDYRARAAALNYAPADVDLLVAVLQDELEHQADAEARRTTISGELAARQLSLAELEDAVKKNLRSLEQYRQQLVTWGYGLDDAQILAALLDTKTAASHANGP
jgi:hypothetical protein